MGSEGDGATPNAVTPTFADNALETLVLQQLEVQALAQREVTVSRADVADATGDYENQLQSQLQQAQAQSSAPTGCPVALQPGGQPAAGLLPPAPGRVAGR